MLVVKTIRFLWPFLKEMILGDKTLKEAVKTNLSRVLLIGLILGSIVLNFLTVPKLLEITYAQVELKRKYTALTRQCSAHEGEDTAAAAAPPASAASAAAPAASSQLQYEQAKEFFERLRQRERQQTP